MSSYIFLLHDAFKSLFTSSKISCEKNIYMRHSWDRNKWISDGNGKKDNNRRAEGCTTTTTTKETNGRRMWYE